MFQGLKETTPPKRRQLVLASDSRCNARRLGASQMASRFAGDVSRNSPQPRLADLCGTLGDPYGSVCSTPFADRRAGSGGCKVR